VDAILSKNLWVVRIGASILCADPNGSGQIYSMEFKLEN